ncbi:hypothetical protein M3Y99_01208000 [Aphelenchoides fujianensis]|nr:hypothetical protein M3Y99_01208000 [Aphelenchoides fujianensis]
MKALTLFTVLFLVACARCAPILFSDSLVMSLLPQTITSAVAGLSAEQRVTYFEVNAKYAKEANGGELNGEQMAAMLEELQKKDPKLHEILRPVMQATEDKLARMDDSSSAFLDGYLNKVGSLTPLLAHDRDEFIRQLLKYADAQWSTLPEESRAHFRREFPQMAAVFEDTPLLKLAGVRSR